MRDLRKEIPCLEQLGSLGKTFSESCLEAGGALAVDKGSHPSKIVPSLEEAIRRCGLQDGMTISFHHHFRNGDQIVNMVLDKLAEMGFHDLVLAASSLTDCHAPLIRHIQNGVIRRIETSGLRGKLADAISGGKMDVPVVFRSHGGRACAISQGELPIDVAFLGAPSCDAWGTANGYSRDEEGGILCGSMGYAKCDAQYARKTVILTSHVVPCPNLPCAIPSTDVDCVVEVESIGDPAGIMSGATRFTKNPKELLMAESAAEVIAASGVFHDGFSFQMGSGGASLAVARFLGEKMKAAGITASYALGGITGSIVDMYEAGLVRRILDVQSFDLRAAESLKQNRFHQQISAGIDVLSADQYFIVALADYSRPNLFHSLEQDVGISYIRHIVDQTLTICHDRCR